MPKQVWKIDQFHGGINSSADPRDITDNELVSATDIMVDNIGRIRSMGSTGAHASDSPAPTAGAINPGYGLFRFSHDQLYAHIGSNHLDEGDFATHANWDENGDWNDGVNPPAYAHSGGTGYIEQVAANRLEAGIGSIGYIFKYTIAGLDSDSEIDNLTSLYLKGGSGYFPSYDVNLTKKNGTWRSIVFASHADAATGVFRIYAASSDTTTFTIDDVSLIPSDTGVTGDDYLLFSDADTTGVIHMYSRANDKWGTPITSLIDNTVSTRQDNFYYVDGALRICDGVFGNNNSAMWYGYIDRTWFRDVYAKYDIKQWYQIVQEISPPNASYYSKDTVLPGGTSGDTLALTEDSATIWNTDRSAINTALHGSGAHTGDQTIYSCTVDWKIDPNDSFPGWAAAPAILAITCGPFDSTDGFHSTKKQVQTVHNGGVGSGVTGTTVFYFDKADALTSNTLADWATGSGTDQFQVEITTDTSPDSTPSITNAVVAEGVADIELDSGGSTFANGYSDSNNVIMMFDWATTTAGGTGWNDVDNTGKWNIGATFIYDEKQESKMTELTDETDGSTVTLDMPGTPGAAVIPGVLLAIASPHHNGDGDGTGTNWNKRITGCNIYMKDVASGTNQPYYLQAEVNFLTGKLRIASTQQDIDVEYNADAANQSYFYWNMPTQWTDPSSIITYEANTGYITEDIGSVLKYKTSVITNRMAYIANLEISTAVGTTEIMGDAMVKSSVNKFDSFPLSRVIEVSVRDGDEIVKLEEFADRILQFKKNKLHIINVSQQIEFLEETLMHKGVAHPAAVCKTDFGVAWVNKFGCYLYDGKQVHNLLERKGMKIIKDTSTSNSDSWEEFAANEPMIKYLPKKRQLLIADDITADGDGSTYLYDMVTQSWIRGAAATITDQNKTNFVIDWNGDVVFAHTIGTILQWNDASAATSTISFKTKDMDFGQPAQRKKIYKVYISYKGDGSAVTVAYQSNGDTDAGSPFYRTTADGSSDGTNSDTTPLLNVGTDDWVPAELKPVSSINNVYSFQLIFDGTAAADFEINDISIIYRLKGLK